MIYSVIDYPQKCANERKVIIDSERENFTIAKLNKVKNGSAWMDLYELREKQHTNYDCFKMINLMNLNLITYNYSNIN